MDAPIIKVCGECLRIFTPEELNDDDWGHPCKGTRYSKKNMRCQSYLAKYILNEQQQEPNNIKQEEI